MPGSTEQIYSALCDKFRKLSEGVKGYLCSPAWLCTQNLPTSQMLGCLARTTMPRQGGLTEHGINANET